MNGYQRIKFLLNLFTHKFLVKSDQHQLSPFNTNTYEKNVMRITKIITLGRNL